MSLCSIKSAETRKEKNLQNGKDVGMAQKGQKQERMSCGEVFAVCGFHIQGYCTIFPHLASLPWIELFSVPLVCSYSYTTSTQLQVAAQG